MLERVLAMALCLCLRLRLCLSVTNRCSVETVERIDLRFGVGDSSHPSHTVHYGNSCASENTGTSLWDFVPNSGLQKFCFGISIVETCRQLSSTNEDAQRVISWTVVGQLQLTIPLSCDVRPLVYYGDRRALPTARFRRAGP